MVFRLWPPLQWICLWCTTIHKCQVFCSREAYYPRLNFNCFSNLMGKDPIYTYPLILFISEGLIQDLAASAKVILIVTVYHRQFVCHPGSLPLIPDLLQNKKLILHQMWIPSISHPHYILIKSRKILQDKPSWQNGQDFPLGIRGRELHKTHLYLIFSASDFVFKPINTDKTPLIQKMKLMFNQ